MCLFDGKFLNDTSKHLVGVGDDCAKLNLTKKKKRKKKKC